jgi:hypothetical protein
MAKVQGLVSVVLQLRQQRTNLANHLKHVDAALSVLKKCRLFKGALSICHCHVSRLLTATRIGSLLLQRLNIFSQIVKSHLRKTQTCFLVLAPEQRTPRRHVGRPVCSAVRAQAQRRGNFVSWVLPTIVLGQSSQIRRRRSQKSSYWSVALSFYPMTSRAVVSEHLLT